MTQPPLPFPRSLHRFAAVAAIVLLAATWACAPAADTETNEPADLVIHNGKVVTVDDAVPEGEGIVINGDRIVLVGSNAEVEAYIGPDTEVIDLQGSLAIPGFIEGHGHFMGIGNTVMNLEKAWMMSSAQVQSTKVSG